MIARGFAMHRRPAGAAWVALSVTAVGLPSADAGELLHSIDRAVGGAAAPFEAIEGLQFVIDFRSLVDPGLLERFGEGVFWQDGDSGSTDFTNMNSPEFAQFSFLVTNGSDDDLSFLTLNQAGTGSGGIWQESLWGFGNPDLAGNEIDFVRLIVHDLTIEPYILPPPFGEGLQWDGNITWQFWGTPVPEPATASLLLAGLLLHCGGRSFRGRRPRRV